MTKLNAACGFHSKREYLFYQFYKVRKITTVLLILSGISLVLKNL